ncbi:unnamed protein product, partial [Rotaria magnacalcarata]
MVPRQSKSHVRATRSSDLTSEQPEIV